MNQLNLQSNYWKTDQYDNQATSLSPTNTSLSKDLDTIAVSSNNHSENLQIYQLTNNSLIHLASITLLDIHTLKFLKPTSEPPYDFKFLLSGHSNGIAHLSAIPLNDNPVFENAEIIKRFNHTKHIDSNFIRPQLCLNNGKMSTSITSIQLTNKNWKSTPLNSMISIYDHHVFLWDTSRSRSPISIVKIEGASNMSLNYKRDSLAAIVGNFGVSLLDLRTGNDKYKTSLYTPITLNGSSLGCSEVEWCETDDNYLATIDAKSDVVQLWDIRKMSPITQLKGFTDSVTNIKWRNNTIWTGDNDGNLIRWDASNLNDLSDKVCTVINKRKFSNLETTVSSSAKKPSIENGNSMKISNNKIISLEYINDNNDDIIALDANYLSSHEVNKFADPKPMKRISCNTTQPVEPSSLSKRYSFAGSACSSESCKSSQIFDSYKEDFRMSSNSTSNLNSPNSIHKKTHVSEYLREIDNLINSVHF